MSSTNHTAGRWPERRGSESGRSAHSFARPRARGSALDGVSREVAIGETHRVFPPQPFSLSGERAQLVPLSVDHAEGLWTAADDEVFANLPYARPTSVEAMREWIRGALGRRGLRLPFAAVVEGSVIGTTSYWYPDPVRRQIEIGSTWLGRPWWGSGVNGEVKRLLIGHAFTGMGCDKVVFRTDPANSRSQRALERLGAVCDGLVRRDWPRPDGSWRDSMYYSILAAEWTAWSYSRTL
jgi:RimJ/RimL family protein N-acetyltransferase